MDIIGNQQERLSFDKGWLAGIIDGEGHITLARQPYRSGYHFRPMITVGNTNPVIVKKIVDIAQENNLPVYVFTPKPGIKSTRTFWRIQLIGLKRCSKWADFLRGNLIGKSKQLDIMDRYIKYRLSIPLNYSPTSINVSEKDEAFKEEMMKANNQYKGKILNDYTLEATN